MSRRSLRTFSPNLERLEAKQVLSSIKPAATPVQGFPTPSSLGFPFGGQNPAIPVVNISFDRVTNPKGRNALFDPPFGHVLVQSAQPVPGKVYNVLFLSVYNATKQTFTASDNLRVRTTNTQRGVSFPILTGDETWAPGGRIVFYVISKRYFPFTPTQTSGFQVNFASPKATGIPGPSGILARVRYNPATFLNKLDYAVTSGPGSYGHELGLPDTAIWQILVNNKNLIHL